MVAEGDQPFFALYAGRVADDFGFERAKLGQAAMHVANRVDCGWPGVKSEARVVHLENSWLPAGTAALPGRFPRG